MASDLPTAPSTIIVGLGETGLSCARFLQRTGEAFAVCDSRADPPGLAALRRECPEVRVDLGPFDAARLKRARTLIVNPGVSLAEPAVAAAREAGVECIGDIELFARAADAPVIAITGTNGKSTVTSMTAALLRHAGYAVRAGGNLSPPALDLLAAGEGAPDFYVLELSSFQLERTFSLYATAATVLNVSADHLDRYSSLAAYAAAKGRIYDGARAAAINRDDPGAASLGAGVAHRIGFGLGVPAEGDFGLIDCDGTPWLAEGARPLLPATELQPSDAISRVNALAALALLRAAGVDPAPAAPALAAYEGLPHRMRLVAERGGVRWFDDSKGTNVGATVAAVEGMEAPVVLIAGGDGKGADFTPLREPVARRARAVVVLGQDAARLGEALAGTVPLEHASDLDDAVARAGRLARPGDAILLSPACAAYDMFQDYRERGRAFAAAVTKGAA